MLTDCALCDMLFDSWFWGFSEIPYPPNRNEQAQSDADAQQDVRIHFKSSKYRCALARSSVVSALLAKRFASRIQSARLIKRRQSCRGLNSTATLKVQAAVWLGAATCRLSLDGADDQ